MSDDALAEKHAALRMHAIIGSLLVGLIAFEVNYLSFRHFSRWDVTEDERFTLSERTDEVLARLEKDIEIVVLLSDAEPNFGDVRELVDRYRAGSPRVRVVYIDPDKQPGEARRAAERYDIEIGVVSSGESFADVAAVVTAEGQRWKITRDDLFSVDFDSLDETNGPQVDVKSERALTGAIVQVTQGEATKVCITSGRGEWGLSGERSLYLVREELERENLELQDLPAVGLREIPEDCDAVFVLGPQRAFAPEEARRLTDWVKAGGHLLLAFDPIFDRDEVEATGFEDPLRDLGIVLDQTVVLELDPRFVLRGDPTDLFAVVGFGDHPTTNALSRAGGSVAVSLVRSVRAEAGTGATELLLTSDAAYAETDIGGLIADRDVAADADDLQGPVGLAVANEMVVAQSAEGETVGRVIVIGDSDWIDGPLLMEPQFGNLDLLMAWTGWLTEREALISIPPRRSNLQAVVMSEADVSGVALRVFVLLPAAFLLLGFAVWWSRRQ
ncbi:MAG: GldG family protein [Myxococcota bacterium]